MLVFRFLFLFPKNEKTEDKTMFNNKTVGAVFKSLKFVKTKNKGGLICSQKSKQDFIFSLPQESRTPTTSRESQSVSTQAVKTHTHTNERREKDNRLLFISNNGKMKTASSVFDRR